MYIGRTLQELNALPYDKWTIEELAYHLDTMGELDAYLNDEGRQVLKRVQAEIQSRGGLPRSEGAYDQPSGIIYE